MKTITAWLRTALPALVTFLLFVLTWQAFVWLAKPHPVTLPSPWRVAQAAWAERTDLVEGFTATGLAALLGLLCSVGLGVITAILFSQSRWVRAAFYPYVIFLQTVPIVAIAPLLITWFGYGFKTIVLVSMIICLFPIVSNVTSGLISIDQNLMDLFRLRGASRWQTLCKLRIPHAVSHLVLGLRISAGLAVIGAIVGEFFVGTNATGFAGLGTIMTGWQNLAKTDAVMAAVFVSTVLGLTMLGGVNAFCRLVLRRWTRGAFENE